MSINNVIQKWIIELKEKQKQKIPEPGKNVYNWLNTTINKIKNKFSVFKNLLSSLENAVSTNLNTIISKQSIASDTNNATQNIDNLNEAIFNELKNSIPPPIPINETGIHNESIQSLESQIGSELNNSIPPPISTNETGIHNNSIQSLESQIGSELKNSIPPPISTNETGIHDESIQSLESQISSELNNSINKSNIPVNAINNEQNRKVILNWLQMIIAKYRLKRAIENNMREIIQVAPPKKDNIPDIKPLEQLIQNGLMELIGITSPGGTTGPTITPIGPTDEGIFPIISINKSITVDENVLKQNYGNAIQISGKTVKEFNERFGNTHIGNSNIIDIDTSKNMPSIKINNKDQNMSNNIFNQLGNQYIAELREIPIVYVDTNQPAQPTGTTGFTGPAG